MVAIAAAVLVAFIGGLWFITHHKKEEAEALQGNKVVGNGYHRSRKSAGAISKSLRAASRASARRQNLLPVARWWILPS